MIVPAHVGSLEPHDVLRAWSWDPLMLVTILLTCWWYARGVRALGHSAGCGEVVAACMQQ